MNDSVRFRDSLIYSTKKVSIFILAAVILFYALVVIPEVSDTHSGKFWTPRSPLFRSS